MKLQIVLLFTINGVLALSRSGSGIKKPNVISKLEPGDEQNVTPWTSKGHVPSKIQPRIIGGEYAFDVSIPFQASLIISNFHNQQNLCGGVLITDEWILSAAHCFEGIIKSVQIGLGSAFLEHPLYKAWATMLYVHGGWNRNNFENDIALLRIPKVQISKEISPAIVSPLKNWSSSDVIASGWGKTKEDGTVSFTLKYAPMNITDTSVCGSHFGAEYSRSSIICVSTESGKLPCEGDSGGPLFYENTRDVVGISSFASTSGCTRGPVGFTRVINYLDWIKEFVMN